MADCFRQGAVDVVRGSDRLNAEQADELRPLVESTLHRGQPRVVIDLVNVPLIDSDGLEFLLDMRDLCLRRGGECKLSGAGPLCRDILRVSGVAEEIEILPDMVTAAGSFAR